MIDQRITQSLLFQVYCLLVAAAVGLSAVVLSSSALGDEERPLGDGGPRELVGWVPWFSPEFLWGMLFLILGALMIWGIKKNWVVHVLRFALVVYLFLAISFATSSAPTALSLMGAVLAAVIAFVHLVVSVRVDVYGWE